MAKVAKVAKAFQFLGDTVEAVAKKLVEFGYPDEVATRMADGSLPMDEASKAARFADRGLLSDVYHGAARFDNQFPLDDLDLGLHVGIPDQANLRLQDLAAGPFGTRSQYEYPDAARVFPLKANLNNQLVMPDAGDWKDSYQVLTALRQTPLYKKYQSRFLDLEDQINEFQMEMNSDILWRKTPENRAILNELRQIIQDEGYDTIKYANAVENQYGNLAGYTPEAEALRTQIADEISRIEGAAHDKRMALLPEDTSAPDAKEAVQRFLATKLEDLMTPEELARIESLKAESRRIANDPTSTKDSNSYIILDPDRNAASRFAAADPEYSGPNILGSRMTPTAAAGLLPTDQVQRENSLMDIAAGMQQLGYDKDRPEAQMYNYSKYLPIKRHKDTGEYSPAMTGLLEDITRGVLDVSQILKGRDVTNPQSIWEILL